jgi:nucleoside 2-deoxyribosyltransferase
MASARPQVYVAGPGGFDAAGRAWHRSVCAHLSAAGFDVLDPWAASASEFERVFTMPTRAARLDALRNANRAAGATNAAMIREADAVLALLDGVDVDSGSAAEIGYAAAVGTAVVGYRTDWRNSGDNEAAVVNLQVEYFIEHSGGAVISGGPSVDDRALFDEALAALRARV